MEEVEGNTKLLNLDNKCSGSCVYRDRPTNKMLRQKVAHQSILDYGSRWLDETTALDDNGDKIVWLFLKKVKCVLKDSMTNYCVIFLFSNPPFESRCHCKLLFTGTTSKFVLQKKNMAYQRYPCDKENRWPYMSHLARPKIPMFPKIQNWRLLLPLKHVSFMWLVILNLNANQQNYNYNYNSN